MLKSQLQSIYLFFRNQKKKILLALSFLVLMPLYAGGPITLTNEGESIPFNNFNFSSSVAKRGGYFRVTATVSVAPQSEQRTGDDWLRYFTVAGDRTDQFWCAQRTDGNIACGVFGHDLRGPQWAIGTWGGSSWWRVLSSPFGRTVTIKFYVMYDSIALYVDDLFMGSMRFNRPFELGSFNKTSFGNNYFQNWQTLRGTYRGFNIKGFGSPRKCWTSSTGKQDDSVGKQRVIRCSDDGDDYGNGR